MKLNIEEFRKKKIEIINLKNELDKIDVEIFKKNFLVFYYGLERDLLSYDLSDIPSSEWEGITILADENNVMDLSKTKANVNIDQFKNFKYVKLSGLDIVKNIRKKIIEEGVISQMVTLPSNMFSSVTLPATLWFFDKQKPNTDKKNEILFIDARNVFTQIDRAHRKFSNEQIKNLGVITKLYQEDTQALVDLIDEYKAELTNALESSDDKEVLTKAYWQSQIDWLTERFPDGVYTDVIGLCKAAPMDGEDGIIDQDYSLNAGRYVGVVIEDDGLTYEEFKEEMYSLNSEFTTLSVEAKKLEELITNNLKELLGE